MCVSLNIFTIKLKNNMETVFFFLAYFLLCWVAECSINIVLHDEAGFNDTFCKVVTMTWLDWHWQLHWWGDHLPSAAGLLKYTYSNAFIGRRICAMFCRGNSGCWRLSGCVFLPKNHYCVPIWAMCSIMLQNVFWNDQRNIINQSVVQDSKLVKD